MHLRLILALFYNFVINHSLSYFYSIHFQYYFYTSTYYVYDLNHYFNHFLNFECTFVYYPYFIHSNNYLFSFYFKFILSIDSKLERVFFIIIIFISYYDLQIMSSNDYELLSAHLFIILYYYSLFIHINFL